jgi:hypothetical protein
MVAALSCIANRVGLRGEGRMVVSLVVVTKWMVIGVHDFS